MSRKFDQRLLDTNAMVMGGGVSLAALESMFNLVQTQSLLAATMVRDHDLSHGLAFEALALSLGEVLDPGVCRSCRRSSAVDVDIPASPAADTGNRRGALANADALNAMANDSQSNTTLQSTASGVPLEEVVQLIESMLQLYRDSMGSTGAHMSQVIDHFSKASQNRLMVT